MWDIIWFNVISTVLVCPLSRENILVMDIFFEALNYEKIEQKKAYEIAGLLGKILAVSGSLWQKNVSDLGIGALSGPPPHISHRVFTPGALRFPLWTRETGWTHFHNLMLLQGQAGLGLMRSWGLMDTFDNSAQITHRYWIRSDSAGNAFTHRCSITVPVPYLFISLLLGDIGGQMGLFIGASVLTILEIFDYLYEVKWWFSLIEILFILVLLSTKAHS